MRPVVRFAPRPGLSLTPNPSSQITERFSGTWLPASWLLADGLGLSIELAALPNNVGFPMLLMVAPLSQPSKMTHPRRDPLCALRVCSCLCVFVTESPSGGTRKCRPSYTLASIASLATVTWLAFSSIPINRDISVLALWAGDCCWKRLRSNALCRRLLISKPFGWLNIEQVLFVDFFSASRGFVF